MQYLQIIVILIAISGCTNHPVEEETEVSQNPYIMVLGTVQDGGSPHAACDKDCCANLFDSPDKSRMVVSLGLVDPSTNSYWLFEATPDLPRQMKLAGNGLDITKKVADGIFLTHAHIGHYTGLMYLGKESMNSSSLPVYAMPRMDSFLRNNGPWSQLVKMDNIDIKTIHHQKSISLAEDLVVTPFLVPHRDEYSETVGYKIVGPNKSLLFIPDINKWSIWDKSLIDELDSVDFAFIDATFYDGNEIKSRDISQIPHPFVIETQELLKDVPESTKGKIHFIHFNHTNPLLDTISMEFKQMEASPFNVARFMQRHTL